MWIKAVAYFTGNVWVISELQEKRILVNAFITLCLFINLIDAIRNFYSFRDSLTESSIQLKLEIFSFNLTDLLGRQ